MSLQVDGKTSLPEQERQLQFVETFFVEVIDYVAASNGNNDVTTKSIPGAVAQPLQLKQIAAPADLTAIASAGATIVFDRVAFVLGARERVVGFRA
ncbi:MAG: hypothetical protein SFV54_00250 [Bryobacteraceae bacterium]|nr:hypothetical protein [Bryobacteraceae bacterium]